MIDVRRSDWRRVRFGDVVESVTERVDDPSTAGVDRYVGLEHLDPGSLSITRWGSPSDVEATKLRFKPGDVVFARRRAYQRKLGAADFEGIASAHSLVLRARPGHVLPEFLPVFLSSDLFMNRVIQISVGSLSPTASWKTLAVQEFVLPPLDEQRRIAALVWSIERMCAAARTLETSLVGVTWALAEAAFGDKARVPAERLFEITMGRQRSPHKTEGPITPYLRAANVKQGALALDDVKQMPFTEPERKRFALQSGDLLVTEGCGSPEQIGANAVWLGDSAEEVTCFQNTVLRYRAIPGSSTPRFLQVWAEWAFRSHQFQEVAVGTGILHIGSERAKAMLVPHLTLGEQDALSARLGELDFALRAACQRRESTELLRTVVRRMLIEGAVE